MAYHVMGQRVGRGHRPQRLDRFTTLGQATRSVHNYVMRQSHHRTQQWTFWIEEVP